MCICCSQKKERVLSVKNGYKITRCSNCGLIYAQGTIKIEDLKEFYSDGYFNRRKRDGIGFRDYLEDEHIHRLNFSSLAKMISKNACGNLLDIGCGYGLFLDEARKKGWNVYGTEISAQGYKYAMDILGINVANQELKDCKFNDDYFDLVSLLGVVEHLIDPLAELKEINRITKSDARLIITTLDIFAPVRFLKCFSYKPPEHMFYFSRKTLGKLLNMAGFEVESVSSYWRYYTLDDIVKRVEEFCFGDARFCSSCLEKTGLNKLIVRIPVNEMLVIARKMKGNSVQHA